MRDNESLIGKIRKPQKAPKNGIIDSHAHVGSSSERTKFKQDPEDLLGLMEKDKVDKAVVFPFDGRGPLSLCKRDNTYVAHAVERYPERLIGFSKIDPALGGACIGEVERSIEELGLKGVKLCLENSFFSMDSGYTLDVIKKASEMEVPIIFDSEAFATMPEAIGRIAEKFPDTSIIMPMKGMDYMKVAREYENVFLSTTRVFESRKLKEVLEAVGARKLISGSDSPYIPMEIEMQKFDFVSKRDRSLILGKNIKRMLGV